MTTIRSRSADSSASSRDGDFAVPPRYGDSSTLPHSADSSTPSHTADSSIPSHTADSSGIHGPATVSGRVATLALLAIIILSPIAATGGVVAADDGPAIAVAVNGEDIADGDRRIVETASFTVRVSDDVDLSTVVIRMDGEEYATLSPDGSSVERQFDPDFPSTDTTVQVIATNANDVTTNHRFTVYRDTVPPKIGLSSPFEVRTGYQFPDRIERTNASITVRGSVQDAASITDFEARLNGGGEVSQTKLSANSTFELETTLDVGNNSLLISATDEYGNQRLVHTQIEVTDESPPSIAVPDWPGNVTTSDVISPTVRANDSVGIESIRYRVQGQPERTLIEPLASLFDRGRTQIERPVDLQFNYPGTYNVTFNATDTANHSTEITETIEYDPVTPEEAAVPEIVRHTNRSGMIDDTTYHLNATVRNGNVTRVVVESTRNRTQRVLAYQVVHDGEARSTVAIDRNLTVARATNDITIEAIDSYGKRHMETFVLDAETADDLQTATTTTSTTTASTTSTAASGDTPTTSTTTSTTGAEPITTIDVERETPLTPRTTTVNSTPLGTWLVPLAMAIAFLIVRIRGG